MQQDIRARVLEELHTNMTTEQLRMVELAVSRALTGYKVEPMETLPEIPENENMHYLTEFLIRKRMEGCKAGTLYNYNRFLREFLFSWNRPLKDFSDMDAILFLELYEMRHQITKRTLDNKRIILSSFFTFLHDGGKIPANPMKKVKKIRYLAKEREPLNDEELETVRQCLQTPKERALFEFLYATGCRISELVRTDILDVDFERRTLRVIGKRDKERTVYFNAKAKLSLQSYLATRNDDCPALFATNRDPHRAGKEGLEKIIRQIGIRSGIGRDVFPHLLRHTFATDYLNANGNVTDLQQLLGHNKTDTTMIYAKILQERISAEYRRCMR